MELIVSLSNNILRLSVNTKEGFKSAFGEMSSSVVDDWKVTDAAGFSSEFNSVLEQIPDIKKKSLEMVYLIEPTEVLLKFVTIGKNDMLSDDEQVLAAVKDKLDGQNIEDLYFSYQKIAPFVYQFIAIKKEELEKYLEIANELQISLKAVIPWVLAVPKFLESNDPFVFILISKERQTILLAELNGVYYSEDFDGTKTPDQIKELVHKLSVYKRSDPISKVYTLVKNGVELENRYKVIPIMELNEDFEQAQGYELHILVNEVINNGLDYNRTQFNLLNLFPIPVIKEKKPVKVYAGVAAVVAVLVLGGLGVYFLLSSNGPAPENELAQEIENTAVLSENDKTNESTNSASDDVSIDLELNKEDIKIRVENGAGVAGVAGSTQELLEELGYVVDGIGNADETGRDNTLIKVKDDVIVYKDILLKDLEGEFDIVFEGGLDESLDYDVLIVVGLN